MATIEQLKKTGQDIYPVTTPEAVRDSQGTNLDVILAGKQPIISDLASIRSGASAGATAVQPSAITDMETQTHASQTYATKTELNGKSHVEVSATGTATDEIQYITIDGEEKKLAGGGGGTSDFDELTNRPKYNGSAMTHETNIPEVKTATWDGKQDKIDADHKLAYSLISGTPSIPSALSELSEDTAHRVVTDAEKTAWNAKGTYSKPSGGIPSSDLASAVQTSLGKADSALQTKADVEGVLTGEISTHTHPHDSTKQNVIDSTHKLSSDLVDDTDHTNKFVTADSVKDVLPGATQSLTTESKASVRNNLDTPANMYNTAPAASASAYEIPYDTMYALGTLTGAITLTLASITAGDTLLHIYAFTFTADTTAPTITWPAGISWQGGSAPTITAGKSYELSILNNKALISEY